VLRQFADELKERPELEIGDHIIETAQHYLGVAGFDREFLDYYLELGEAILLFDGVDELPGLVSNAACATRSGPCCGATPAIPPW